MPAKTPDYEAVIRLLFGRDAFPTTKIPLKVVKSIA